MTTQHRSPFLLGIAAIAALGALSACSDSGDPASASEPRKSAEPTTLEFLLDVENGDFDQSSFGGKGDAVGNHHYSAMTLLDDGVVAGRALLDCLVADPTYEGQMCSGVLLLDGGTLSVQNAGEHKAIEGVDYGEESFAVTGGTGDYVGASGEMTVGEAEEGPLTSTLLPQTSN
jgi:hypothetical protein